jgi:mevalonate kinase
VLLTGEYFVLDGALALALPTKLGQWMRVTREAGNKNMSMLWRSLDEQGYCWFNAEIDTATGAMLSCDDGPTGSTLQSILQAVAAENPDFMRGATEVETQLEFSRFWGLGSSSSLVYLIASWGKVNPFILLEKTMGGSGYDVACAGSDRPILYQIADGRPSVVIADFHPPFAEQLYFVYLGQKQSSREGIVRYRSLAKNIAPATERISELTKATLGASNLPEFERVITEHEAIVGNTINARSAKQLLFPDYWGAVKSLGAWGGDFVLATSNRPIGETLAYFSQKGYPVVLPYKELVNH